MDLVKEFQLRLGKVEVYDSELGVRGIVVGIDLRYSMLILDNGTDNAVYSLIKNCKPYLRKPGDGESLDEDYCIENKIDNKNLIEQGLAYEIN